MIHSHPPEWTGTMKRICMSCGTQYGTKPCLPAHDGKLTHGFCPECHVKAMDELADETKKLVGGG